MPAVVAQAAAQSAEVARELPIPPVAYGLIAFGVLLGLLAVTYAFRHAGSRR